MATESVIVTPPAKPANNATAYLFDTTTAIGTAPSSTLGALRKQYPNLDKIIVTMYPVAQDVTFFTWVLDDAATARRITNGSGSGVTATADTYFERTFDIGGADGGVYVTAGGTAPTTLGMSIKLIMSDKGGA